MTNDTTQVISKTPQNALYEKMSGEYDAFIRNLMLKQPDIIIESAYEKVFKEDLLLCADGGDFTDEQAEVLLELDYPLELLYQEWLDSDVSYMDLLRDCIDCAADVLIKDRRAEQANPESPERDKPQTVSANNRSPQKLSFMAQLQEAKEKAEACKSAQAAAPAADKKHREAEL